MKNFIGQCALFVATLFIGTFSSCRQNEDLIPTPKLSQKAGGRIALSELENESDGYKYFFHVNGVRYGRGQEFHVRAGSRFYVELRFEDLNHPGYELPMPVNVWNYPTNTIRFVRQYTPSYNNANEYEVIAPNILPNSHFNLGTINAYFTAFSGTSSAERRGVTLSLIQDGGGISGVFNY